MAVMKLWKPISRTARSLEQLLGSFSLFPYSLTKFCTKGAQIIANTLNSILRDRKGLVLKVIDRGEYSKKEHLSKTVVAATSILSYMGPSLVLPFVASRFHMALDREIKGLELP